jgi:pyruvate/2-oxoglutarate/acetoin dehydrogenase E1 component
MGAVIHSLRGIVVCVPRNMTKAAGMFNTLMEAHDPALIVEPLNGYRTKEPAVRNLGDFREPIGQVDVVREGKDVTLLSYGSTFNICREAADSLERRGIEVELIDAQTLLPFDRDSRCAQSIEKTNALVIVDEDVPGGASAYLLDDILTRQKAFFHMDSEPVTLTAKAHRPAYSSDGDYFSKPSVDDIYEAVYRLMSERDPVSFPAI